MKIVVTGATGMLGSDLVKELKSRGHEVAGLGSADMDITDRECVARVISSLSPEAVIHCAAWTAVDAAEDPDNREKVRAVNASGTENVALACRASGAKMLYISTDYVFSGKGTEPWKPECMDFSPVNFYGLTKLEGENAVRALLDRYFIVRIAWVFGKNGKNFVKTMLRVGADHDTLRVVNDQIGTPTYTPDLSRFLADLIVTDKFGAYHATNEGGYISWYDFACEIMRLGGLGASVIPVTTAEYGLSKAERPANSRLDRSRIVSEGFQPLPDWRDALKRYICELSAGE